MATNPTKGPAPRFLWNHRVHEEWGKERLYFWRLGFNPTYGRAAILELLKAVMDDLKILSLAVYELTGMYDLLLRVWIPTSVTPEVFDQSLTRRLSEENLHVCEPFYVSKIVSHWVWNERKCEEPRVPLPDILNTRLPDSEIGRVNDGDLTEEEERRYTNQNLVARWQPSDGIKFNLIIPQSNRSLSLEALEALRERLLKILADADDICDVSFYEGVGFAQFLIMGRIDPTKFDGLNTQLLEEINKLQPFFGVRTFTHIVVSSPGDVLPLKDRLPSTEVLVAEDRPLEEYLSKGESHKLEFKGSLRVNLRRWANDGTLEHSDILADEGVLRSLVGLLNGRGGQLIIGVLEGDEFRSESAVARLEEFPRFGNYFVCGVNLDYGKEDWDWFQLRLQTLVRQRITPSASIWITVKREIFRGRDVCIISVRPPTTDWFYLKDDPRFHVREGNSTRALDGPEADAYKRLNSR